jgi:hypothetical protein
MPVWDRARPLRHLVEAQRPHPQLPEGPVQVLHGQAQPQRRARKGLGIPDTKHAGRQGNEENWLGTVRVEVKSGGIAKPAWTVYLRSEVQSEQNRPVGDNRPFVAVFDAGSDRLISIRESKLREVVAALAEMWGWM